MTLRIFEQANEHEHEDVALHGWLGAPEVIEVERVAAAHRRPLRLDHSRLSAWMRSDSGPCDG